MGIVGSSQGCLKWLGGGGEVGEESLSDLFKTILKQGVHKDKSCL